MFFGSWHALGRVVLFTAVAYVLLVLFVRISGKRTLSNINIVDLIVTVALGNVLAMTALSKSVSLAQGAVTMAVLIGIEFVTDWTTVRYPRIRPILYSKPALVYYRGHFFHEVMLRERITDADIRFAARREGLASFENIEAVVLEITGSMTIIQRSQDRPDALADIPRG